MRVTIIPDDGFVSIDGVGYDGLDLSSIDSSIHAVQWYGEEGEVEMRNPVTRKLVENRGIASLDEFQTALDAWNIKKAETEAVEAVEAVEIRAEVDA
jgi:hypothetical protein